MRNLSMNLPGLGGWLHLARLSAQALGVAMFADLACYLIANAANCFQLQNRTFRL